MVSVVRVSLFSGMGDNVDFVGLNNYRLIFRDPLFTSAIKHNIQFLIIVPILIFLSLIFSTLLFEQIRGWRIYRIIIFIPVILAIAAMGIVFGQLLQLKGLLNEFLIAIGLDFIVQDWLGDSKYALWSVAGIIIWKELGFGTMLFLARLMTVEYELYEAARIDGASWWSLMRYVTIPELRHVIEFYGVLMVVTAFSFVFDYILVITNGGPSNSTIVGEFFIYKVGFIYNRLNIAAAVAVIYLIVGIVLMVGRHQVLIRVEE
jgi:ABC-type sugar transport system permease subunit